MPELVMTVDEIQALLQAGFPQERQFGTTIASLEPGRAVVRLPVEERHLRPGGTVSGPTLMALADTAFLYVLLAHLGPQLLAVTTHLSIDFVRKPEPADLLAEASLIKLGKRLAVGHVLIRGAADDRIVAQASVTYAIPGGS